MAVQDLRSHSEPYVTVAELAEYWLVGRKQIYKQIDAGTLPAIRLGPRLLRIRTSDAQVFERSAKIGGSQETRMKHCGDAAPFPGREGSTPSVRSNSDPPAHSAAAEVGGV